MKKEMTGEIILIDDEVYEAEFLKHVLDKLNCNIKVVYFNSAKKGFEYIRDTKTKIFLIISDIRVSDMSGIEMRKAIENNEAIMLKAIPFIFASSTATKQDIEAAYRWNNSALITLYCDHS